MEWIFTVLRWYVYLFAIGLIFYPLTKKIFPRFFDMGYAFSKTIGIITLSFVTFILGILKIMPFSQAYLYILGICFVFINFFILIRDLQLHNNLGNVLAKKPRGMKKKTPVKPAESFITRGSVFLFIFEELLFIAALFFLAYVRGQEPSIRGLEKFMDFGFMNSILRSSHFPPLDMWLSAGPAQPNGYPINYYYFGHLSGAFLIKLTDINAFIGYNLILATIFAQAITMGFSLTCSIIYTAAKNTFAHPSIRYFRIIVFGILGSFLLNFAGNLHTIYLFTSGYPNDNPTPFWKIIAGWNPTKYWYPNATRFIPYTIHEFPSYSYVVADLHGHVFDIPFVLVTLALLFNLFVTVKTGLIEKGTNLFKTIFNSKFLIVNVVFLGFLAAVHYMTNAFDGPIYILLSLALFFLMFGTSIQLVIYSFILIGAFVLFSFPFSFFFDPFVSGIGVNCSPEFLVKMEKLGPFLFEKGKCQSSAPWMLFILWGFFWTNMMLLFIVEFLKRRAEYPSKKLSLKSLLTYDIDPVTKFIFVLFLFGTFLIIIPEFFYIKDIYPDHFRANTMFKMGYQAYMMMSIASAYTLYRISALRQLYKYILKLFFLLLFFFLLLYPFFAFPSYYGTLRRPVELDGSTWLKTTYPEDKEIVDFFNARVQGQPVILEAQGDSYTDFERISAYTGLPTVAGWWVHEWLWRGSADVVGQRIPDIVTIYESEDINSTIDLLKKYKVKYVVVSVQERNKYQKLHEEKFETIGKKIFKTSSGNGSVYELK